jgi:hypothetical protein
LISELKINKSHALNHSISATLEFQKTVHVLILSPGWMDVYTIHSFIHSTTLDPLTIYGLIPKGVIS